MKRGLLCKTGLLVAVALIIGVAVHAQDTGTGAVLKLTLDDALSIALSDNPTIKVAEQQIEVKKISKDEAWQALLPSADFSGTVQYTLLASVMKMQMPDPVTGEMKVNEFPIGRDNTSTWNGQFRESAVVRSHGICNHESDQDGSGQRGRAEPQFKTGPGESGNQGILSGYTGSGQL